jgi:hypothetical protein
MQTDKLERRCPRLGGPVSFTYCRTAGDEKGVCFKILDCWWEYFDVAAYMKAELSAEEFEALSRKKAPSKVTSLLSLIEQARKNTQNKG